MGLADVLAGGGVMGARVRAHNWSGSPLGPPEAWPQSLRTALSIMLCSRFPTYLVWGPDLISFYNDAYAPIIGIKPDALGRPIREVWPEVWDDVGPILARALSGEASYFEDLPLTLERKGYPEETWWTFSYSPIRDGSGAEHPNGGVGGVLCTVLETTGRVLTERRLRFLIDLSNRLRGLADPYEVMAVAAERLGHHLGADRAGYGEVDATGTFFTVERDWTDGAMPSFAGRHRLDDFGPPIIDELRAGRAIRLDDALADPRTAGEGSAAAFAAIGMRAGISVPFVDGGRIAAALYAHQAEPRRWRDGEVALMKEVAERTSEAVRRARAETALRESETRLRTAANLTGLSSYVWHPRTGALEWDSRIKAAWGLPPDAHVDQEVFLAGLHPDDRPRVEAAIAKAIDPSGDGIYEVEHRVVGIGDGVVRWVSTHGRMVFDKGQPVRLIGAVLEITERKRAEERLRESEERFRQFAENTADVLWIMDAETNQLEYLSPAFERVWGEPRDAIMQDRRRWTETLHPEDRERVLGTVERVLAGEAVAPEYRIVRPDRSVRWIRNTFFPIHGEQGRVRRIAGIAHDITQHEGSLVYVLDGNQDARASITPVLQGAGYEVKAFASVRAFLDAAPVLVPGCVVLDIRAPGTGDLAVPKELKARRIGLPVIVVADRSGDAGLAVQAMKAGAADYLEVPYPPEALLIAVASALADIRGAVELDRAVDLAKARIAAMSDRERGVLAGLLAGGTNKSIARSLGISPRTVEAHRAHVMERLDVRTLSEAVLIATAAGQQPLPPTPLPASDTADRT